jgi:hypothetical protein
LRLVVFFDLVGISPVVKTGSLNIQADSEGKDDSQLTMAKWSKRYKSRSTPSSFNAHLVSIQGTTEDNEICAIGES